MTDEEIALLSSEQPDKKSACAPKALKIGGVLLLVVAIVVVIVVFAINGGSGSDEPALPSFISPEMVEGASKLSARGKELGGSRVWERLAYLTDTYGPRFSGTDELEAAMTDIMNEAIDVDGLVAAAEDGIMIPNWKRGNEYVKMISPREKELHMIGLGSSANSGGAPIIAEVVSVASWEELRERAEEVAGKIVLFDVPWKNYSFNVDYRQNGATQAAEYNAVAVLLRSVTNWSMQSPHTGVSVPASIPACAISLEDASQITRMLHRGSNVTVEFYMEMHQEEDFPSKNIVITMEGSEFPNEFVVFGGHIDSWDNAEGAMDDGGGAYACWEAMIMMKELGLVPRRTIKAVFFTNEENGAMGGRDYALRHAADLPNTSIAMESDAGTFTPFRIGFSGSAEATRIMEGIGRHLFKDMDTDAGHVRPGGGGVDIQFMCDEGVPCVGLDVMDHRIGDYASNPCRGFSTLTGNEAVSADLGTDGMGYWWYHHTTADTIDKVDPMQLQDSSTAMALWAYSVSMLDTILPRD